MSDIKTLIADILSTIYPRPSLRRRTIVISEVLESIKSIQEGGNNLHNLTRAAEAQRHIKKNLSFPFMFYFCAYMSLRHYFAFGALQSSYPHFNIYSRKGTGAGPMILTFFVEDNFLGMTANNTNITRSCSCTLRLIGNAINSIKKKGPQNTQNTQNAALRSGSATKHERHRIFFHNLPVFFLCFSVYSVGSHLLGGNNV
jgi:hypothetical protein